MHVSWLSEDVRELRVARPEARRRAWLTVFVFNHARRSPRRPPCVPPHARFEFPVSPGELTSTKKESTVGRLPSRVITDTRETAGPSILDWRFSVLRRRLPQSMRQYVAPPG